MTPAAIIRLADHRPCSWGECVVARDRFPHDPPQLALALRLHQHVAPVAVRLRRRVA